MLSFDAMKYFRCRYLASQVALSSFYDTGGAAVELQGDDGEYEPGIHGRFAGYVCCLFPWYEFCFAKLNAF